MRPLVPFAAALALAACNGASTGGQASSASSSSWGGGSVTGSSSSSGGTGGAASTSSSGGAGGAGGSAAPAGWKLVWSDEFDGADGSDVDPTKWVHEVSGSGNGNKELEYYTPGTANAFQMGGDLHIVAKALPAGGGGLTCWYGSCEYTSGKIVSKAWGKPSLFEKKYGRFAARMKIPAGQGMWPAFWLLGNDITAVSWPTCGEIDTMENIGKEPGVVHGTIHGPDATIQNVSLGGSSTLATGALADAFHEYAVEWQAAEVRFLLDGVPYFTAKQASFKGTWVFDHAFYLILNLAIGGGWPGSPDATAIFPAELLVDWVRVYDPTP